MIPGEIVLDPFLGPGSTLLAAEKTGRICRGVELDPLHVDFIIRRWIAATGQRAFLDKANDSASVEAREAVIYRVD